MAKQLQLNIPTPCHEDWDAMTPVEKGKFCGSCQKQVVDFTSMSDRQVAEFFKKPSTGSVCGRFMSDQLDRTIEIPRKRIPWVKYFFQIALPAFLVSAKASAQKPAKAKQTVVAKPSEKIAYNFPGIKGDVEVVPVQGELYVEPRIKDIVQAKVINETGEAVPYASIETEKSYIKMMADSNGVFELNKRLLVKEENILVSSAGFETTSISTGSNPYEMNDEILISMNSKSLMPAVIVTTYGQIVKGGIMGSVSRCTKSILSQKIDSITSTVIKPLTPINKLKIYPNPVQSGSTINISISGLEEGYYSIQLLNLSGQLVRKREIWIDKEARLLNFDLPSVTGGNYFIILTNKKTSRKFSEKIVIQ